MVKMLEEILIESRRQGQQILPLLLPYCDPATRQRFHQRAHMDREKQDLQIHEDYRNDLHGGLAPGDRPFHKYYIEKADEYGLQQLRGVLETMADSEEPSYHSWLLGVIGSVERA